MIRFICVVVFLILFLILTIPVFFIEWLIGKFNRNARVQGRTVAVLGNGSWAPQSAKLMEAKLAELKNMTLLTENFAVKSALHDSQMEQLQELCTKITDSVNA